MIVIICAMDKELEGLKNAMSERREVQTHGFKFYCGRLEEKETAVCCCGVGKVCAAAATATAIERFSPEIVINSGVAGGVFPLKQGDVVIAERAAEHDYYDPTERTVFYSADRELVRMTAAVCSEENIAFSTGTVATGDQFIDKAEKVRELSVKYGAIAFDMETAAIMKVCFLTGVRCLCTRAVSDNGEDNNLKTFYEFLSEAADRSAFVTKKLLKLLKL